MTYKIAIRNPVYICIMGELLSDLTVQISIVSLVLLFSLRAEDSSLLVCYIMFVAKS
jgi:hypothetical protein